MIFGHDIPGFFMTVFVYEKGADTAGTNIIERFANISFAKQDLVFLYKPGLKALYDLVKFLFAKCT